MTNATLHLLNEDATLEVSGDIDLSNAMDLEDAIAQAAEGASQERVLVDLAHVDFMDAAGLRALVGATEIVAPTKLVLRRPQPNVRRVLELGAPGMFDIED
jgi:anti-anti-sigma factor